MNEAQGDPTSTGGDPATGSAAAGGGRPPSEEELRAAYEAEIKKVRVEHLLLENVVTLINLASRRTGQAPGTEDERDPAQVQLAIESIRALLPVLEQTAPQQIGPIREALSQLQLAFVKTGGQRAVPPEQEAAGAGAEGEPGPAQSGPSGSEKRDQGEAAPPQEGQPGPAQRSGRLWVPGQ